jgi:hypothetical protein
MAGSRLASASSAAMTSASLISAGACGAIGWERELTLLKDRARELCPAYLPPDRTLLGSERGRA